MNKKKCIEIWVFFLLLVSVFCFEAEITSASAYSTHDETLVFLDLSISNAQSISIDKSFVKIGDIAVKTLGYSTCLAPNIPCVARFAAIIPKTYNEGATIEEKFHLVSESETKEFSISQAVLPAEFLNSININSEYDTEKGLFINTVKGITDYTLFSALFPKNSASYYKSEPRYKKFCGSISSFSMPCSEIYEWAGIAAQSISTLETVFIIKKDEKIYYHVIDQLEIPFSITVNADKISSEKNRKNNVIAINDYYVTPVYSYKTLNLSITTLKDDTLTIDTVQGDKKSTKTLTVEKDKTYVISNIIETSVESTMNFTIMSKTLNFGQNINVEFWPSKAFDIIIPNNITVHPAEKKSSSFSVKNHMESASITACLNSVQYNVSFSNKKKCITEDFEADEEKNFFYDIAYNGLSTGNITYFIFDSTEQNISISTTSDISSPTFTDYTVNTSCLMAGTRLKCTIDIDELYNKDAYYIGIIPETISEDPFFQIITNSTTLEKELLLNELNTYEKNLIFNMDMLFYYKELAKAENHFDQTPEYNKISLLADTIINNLGHINIEAQDEISLLTSIKNKESNISSLKNKLNLLRMKLINNTGDSIIKEEPLKVKIKICNKPLKTESEYRMKCYSEELEVIVKSIVNFKIHVPDQALVKVGQNYKPKIIIEHNLNTKTPFIVQATSNFGFNYEEKAIVSSKEKIIISAPVEKEGRLEIIYTVYPEFDPYQAQSGKTRLTASSEKITQFYVNEKIECKVEKGDCTFILTIENSGTDDEEFIIEKTDIKDLNVKMTDSVTISPYKNVNETGTIINYKESGDTTIILSVYPKDKEELKKDVTIKVRTLKSIIHYTAPDKIESKEFFITIYNNGEKKESIYLSVSEDIYTCVDLGNDRVQLLPGESENITFIINEECFVPKIIIYLKGDTLDETISIPVKGMISSNKNNANNDKEDKKQFSSKATPVPEPNRSTSYFYYLTGIIIISIIIFTVFSNKKKKTFGHHQTEKFSQQQQGYSNTKWNKGNKNYSQQYYKKH